MKTANTVIQVENVGLRFRLQRSLFSAKYFEAIKDVNFSIEKGDSVGILGRNGAGKTTLLRLLAGIIKPDKGEIINNSANTALLALQIGFDPELSGKTNAILSGMILGFSKQEVVGQLENIISFSELDEFINQPVNHILPE